VVKRFPGDKLLEIIEKYPEVSIHLFSVLATRLGYANKITIKWQMILQQKSVFQAQGPVYNLPGFI
jgi:hypothetical protein